MHILEDVVIQVSFKPEWTFQANEVCKAKYIKLPEGYNVQEEWYKEEY